ncbi:hypothetical protein PoB_007309700 [Plakobranchus ocellatus]|uniref:Uncharacterized protein n=1 Tax=Plakobranchus ocellatus TaxID=259542 RepID=A0AAV4DQK0_9GAST|nr:hypothetical protein PoB_007309700 [Plakobranchus ocellatus]
MVPRAHCAEAKFLKRALSQGADIHGYTTECCEKLAKTICGANELLVQPKARALVFPSFTYLTKSWCGSAAGMDTLRTSLLDGCDDCEFFRQPPRIKQMS